MSSWTKFVIYSTFVTHDLLASASVSEVLCTLI